MRTKLCAVLLFLLAGATFAYSTCEEDIQQELERERKEDADSQGCRACKKIEVEAAPNCPAKGYDCDESLQVTSTVPSLGSCECAQLRCAASNATLAVDGELVKKVSCKDLKWTTADGEAESAVCARECGLGICPPFPALDPFEEIFFEPLAVQPPDDEHRCAWADCQYGAYVEPAHVFKGMASFACTGNRMWRYAGPEAEIRNLLLAYCIKSDCKPLHFSDDNSLCDTKYSCGPPSFEEDTDNPAIWNFMACPNGEALQFTANNSVVLPFCMLGQWFVGSDHISPASQVMCVNCIGIKKEPLDDTKPDDSDIKTGVTCPDGFQLTIEYGDSKTHTKVDTMKCSADFTWISEGEEFTGFASLDDMITKGTEWTVRCLPKAECGPTICPLPSAEVIEQAKYLVSLNEQPPDENHPCAWGDCEIGGYAVRGGTEQFIKRGAASFACTGDKKWKYTGPEEPIGNLDFIACIKSDCKELDYDPASSFCDSKKYSCYKPSFEAGSSEQIWNVMKCSESLALRRSADNEVVTAQCVLGQWKNGGADLPPDTKVMCVDCPPVPTDDSDEEKPDVTDIKAGVTCPDGYQLTIEYGANNQQAQVDSLRCIPTIVWYTSGGGTDPFNPYPSLEDLISKGIEWKARCIPKVCKELRFGESNTVCTTKKYACKAATFEADQDGGKMTCNEGALRLDTENTPITAVCAKGDWTSGETPIPSDAAVRCISCATVQTDAAPNGDPNVQPNEVTCAGGSQLTVVVYPSGGVEPKDVAVVDLKCSATSFEWAATGGDFTPFSSIADAIDQGASWTVKCVTSSPTKCVELTYGRENVLCDSKYTCTKPDYYDNGDQGATMTCPYGLRRDSDDTPITNAECYQGEWSSEGNPIPSDAKVRCINCKDPITEAAENPAPIVEGNRKVECAPGGGELTVAYIIGGATKETQVSTLFCSPTFDWDTTGGDFAQYGTLAGAVAQGATWTAKCVTVQMKPCAALPSDVNEPYCTADDDGRPLEDSDYRKFGCKTSEFVYPNQNDPFNAYMVCEGGQRRAENPTKELNAQCINGKWKEIIEGNTQVPMPETTKVICVECRPLTKIPEDQVKWDYDNDGTNLSIKCANKQMYLDFRREAKTSSKRFTMASITCNKETQLWDSVGLENGDTIEKLLDRKQLFAVRCLNAGEDPVIPDP